jgi:hypothetical protein
MVELNLPWWYARPEITRMAITHGRVDEEVAKFVNGTGDTFLHCLLRYFAYFRYYRDVGVDDSTWESWDGDGSWRELIRDLVGAGSLLHAINNEQLTPLSCIIYSSSVIDYRDKTDLNHLIEEVSSLLRVWLSDLLDVGVDLQQYGAEEKLLNLAGSVCNDFDVEDTWVGWSSIHLIGFSYGHHPEDWHFWFSDPTDDFAGDFWYLVEDPAFWESGEGGNDVDHTIPGSWTECS